VCTVRLQTKDVQYPSGSDNYQTTIYSDFRALKLGVTPGLRSGGAKYKPWLINGKLSYSISVCLHSTWQMTGDLNHNLQNSTLHCNVPRIPQLFLVWIRQITLVCLIATNGLRLSSTILLHNSVRLYLIVLDYSDNYLHNCGIKR
jgi:hypothetical protein